MRNEVVKDGILITTVGISGSGKSTFLKKHLPTLLKDIFDEYLTVSGIDVNKTLSNKLKLGGYIVSPDNLRRVVYGDVSFMRGGSDAYVWGIAEDMIRHRVENYGLAILDSLFITKKKKFLRKFNTYNVAIVFENDLSLSISRVENDIENGVDRSSVPNDVIIRQNKKYINNVIGINITDYVNYKWTEHTETIIRSHLSSEFDRVIIIRH